MLHRANSTSSRLAVSVLALAALLPPSPARAESHPIETLALGWQTEHADVVFVGRPTRADRPEPGVVRITFAVNETLVGELSGQAAAVVTTADHGHAAGWRPGADHLVFVARREDAARSLVPVSGSYGIRLLRADEPSARFPGLVRDLAAALSDARSGGRRDVVRPDALRAVLVRMLADQDGGVALSGALDLVRHHALHADLTEAQQRQILAAYRAQQAGKQTKPALAAAVGVTGHPDAAALLVDSLVAPRGHLLRTAVGDALHRLRSPRTEHLLAARLADADARDTRTLLAVIGRVGTRRSAAVIRDRLGHADGAVRLEAAHALGTLARNVRRAASGARVSGRRQLEERLAVAPSARERQTLLWALAQLDTQEAYATLRALAEGDERADVRRFAERYLARPRQLLVLE